MKLGMIIYIVLSLFLIAIGVISILRPNGLLLHDMIEKIKGKISIIDKEGLSKFCGIGAITVGIEIFLLGVCYYYLGNSYFTPMRIAIGITLCYLFAASQRYDSTNYEEDGKMKKKTKKIICFISCFIMIIIFLPVFFEYLD